ncbi:MAG: iron uptake porin [Cyanobacteriota bacterium]|nr:iron uptake porin [Cyanobacteriota bacterium]
MSKTTYLAKALPLALGGALLPLSGLLAAPQNGAQPAVSSLGAAPALATQNDALDIMRRRQQMKRFNDPGAATTGMSQVTSVSELRDVQPTEWAFEALKSLVERYGCIVGYPDRTFRGNRALSRWEFAAGLNACMNVMERLIQENVAVLREDIDKLRKLAEQFEQELAAMGARVDNLEARTAYLEDHQFSTTTKLNGITVFALVDQFGDNRAYDWRQQNQFQNGALDEAAPIEAVPTFSSRVRLNFDTSFTGKDRLRTRLQAGSVPNLATVTGTNMARLSFDGSDPENNVTINKLWYRFPIGNFTGWVGAWGLALDDVFQTYNPYLESGDTGALSRFSRYNPFVNRGPEGAGGALTYKFSDQFSLTATYLAQDNQANTPSSENFGTGGRFERGNGFFNGNYTTGAQLNFAATKDLKIGLSYLHKYFRQGDVNLTGSTGSRIASNPFFGAATTMDTYNLQASWKISDVIALSGWFGYASATGQGFNSSSSGFSSVARSPQNRSGLGADLWTWNAALSFLDVFKEGAVLSFSGGLLPYAPYVASLNGDYINNDRNAPYIVEAQYAFPINKNIQITPGIYAIFNPEGNENNPNILVGVIRTSFKF